ncbi:hypothetical protein ACHAW6_007183 [Cyclotella cf. meneghiniana]
MEDGPAPKEQSISNHDIFLSKTVWIVGRYLLSISLLKRCIQMF